MILLNLKSIYIPDRSAYCLNIFLWKVFGGKMDVSSNEAGLHLLNILALTAEKQW